MRYQDDEVAEKHDRNVDGLVVLLEMTLADTETATHLQHLYSPFQLLAGLLIAAKKESHQAHQRQQQENQGHMDVQHAYVGCILLLVLQSTQQQSA